MERLIEDLPDALRRDGELIDRSKRTTKVVYRLVDGKAVCTPVRPGPSDLTHTLVPAGLSANDVVVVGPYKVLEKIRDGEAIRDEDEVRVDAEADATEEPADDGTGTDDPEAPAATEAGS